LNAINRPESYAVRQVRAEVESERTRLQRLTAPLLKVMAEDVAQLHGRAPEWEMLANAAALVARLEDTLKALVEGTGADELHAKLAYELTGAVCRDEQRLSAQCDRRALAHVLRMLERVL
jgi:hypothetical protein